MEVNDFGVGHGGKPMVRFSARTEIRGNEYGVIRGMLSAVVSKKVEIILKIEASKQD
jgi:hypothetical protein